MSIRKLGNLIRERGKYNQYIVFNGCNNDLNAIEKIVSAMGFTKPYEWVYPDATDSGGCIPVYAPEGMDELEGCKLFGAMEVFDIQG